MSCTGGARHWFAYYGWVGSSSPVCRRCGAPNPHYRPADDVADSIEQLRRRAAREATAVPPGASGQGRA